MSRFTKREAPRQAPRGVDWARRRAILGVAGFTALGVGAHSSLAWADDAGYPSRAVRIINPYAAGSSVDVVGRLIADRLRTVWNQPVIVENRTGAGGTVGAAAVAKAAPDGYTLFVSVPTPVTVAPWVFKSLPYDAEKDLVPVWGVLSGGLALVVHPSFPAETLQEFIEYVKANPGKVRYGSAGVASPQHLAAEMFRSRTGTELVHVPYQGAVPAMTDLIGGHVDVMFDAIQHVVPHVRAGKIRALAMLREKRPLVLPELRTAAEQGLTGVEPPGSVGVYAPGKTPPQLLAKIAADIDKVMNDDDVKRKLSEMGMTTDYVHGQAFIDRVNAERVLFERVVKDAGIQPR